MSDQSRAVALSVAFGVGAFGVGQLAGEAFAQSVIFGVVITSLCLLPTLWEVARG